MKINTMGTNTMKKKNKVQNTTKKNKRNKSIRGKINLSFIILLLLSSVILGAISIKIAERIISDTATEAVETQASEVAKLEASRLNEKKASLMTMSQIKEIQYMNWPVQRLLLGSLIRSGEFIEVGILKSDGTLNYYVNEEFAGEVPPAYLKALEEDKNAVFFEMDQETREITLTQIVPIKKDDEVVGAILGIRDGEYLSEIADETSFGETGYGYIINNSGTMIGHRDRDYVHNQFTPVE